MRLTGRAVALIAVAAVSLTLAAVAGIPSLLYVTGLSAGLVVVAVAAAAVAQPRLSATRHVWPRVVDPDEPVEVSIEVMIDSRLPVAVGRWRDRAPSARTGAVSGRVPIAAGQSSPIRYEAHARRRGEHEVGPLSVTVGDAFGLVERTLIGADHDRFIVLPRRVPLAVDRGAGADDGASRIRRASGLGHDDVVARQHLPGDALKRWHWKATAHRGEPMVRQEEAELHPTVQIVLDVDPRVHDQAGFEWSVSAAASAITHFGDRAYDVDLVCGSAVVALESGHGAQEALVALALAEPTVEPLTVPARQRATFVFTGRLDAVAAERLVTAVTPRDTVAFVARGTSDEALSVLAAAGWRVVERDAADELERRWAEASAVRA